MSHPPDPELLAITDEGGCDLNCDAVMRLTLDVDDAFLAATIAGARCHPIRWSAAGSPSSTSGRTSKALTLDLVNKFRDASCCGRIPSRSELSLFAWWPRRSGFRYGLRRVLRFWGLFIPPVTPTAGMKSPFSPPTLRPCV